MQAHGGHFLSCRRVRLQRQEHGGSSDARLREYERLVLEEGDSVSEAGPERWRQYAAGSAVTRAVRGCDGLQCYIVPVSRVSNREQHQQQKCWIFTLDLKFNILNLAPKEHIGEKFDGVLAQMHRCIDGRMEANNDDSDSDTEVVADSV